jgi:RNA-directed DNA polymerase
MGVIPLIDAMRPREELAKLRVEINEDKTRMVDLNKEERFTFLGFEYRRILSSTGVWRPNYAPKRKKRTALFGKLREIFRSNLGPPVRKVIEAINPILPGWVNYFRTGHSSPCFSKIKAWVEKKIRRHTRRARHQTGLGWKRWSREWLYAQLGLFNDYPGEPTAATPESRPNMIGLINLGRKRRIIS